MKKFICLCLAILLCLSMAACHYTKEELAEKAAWEQQGRENIISYIREKYDADIEIQELWVGKLDPGPVPDPTPSYTSWVYAKGTISGKECLVMTNAKYDSTEKCYDNYQHREIYDAIVQYVTDVTAGTLLNCNVMVADHMFEDKVRDDDGNTATQEVHLIHKKYNGDIVEFLEDTPPSYTKVFAGCCTTSLSDLNIDTEPFEDLQEVAIVNFSVDAPEAIIDTPEYYRPYTLKNYLPYIKEVMGNWRADGTTQLQTITTDIKQTEDFLYAIPFGETVEFSFGRDEQVDLSNWNSEGKTLETVSNIYTVNSNYQVYFPTENIANYESSGEYKLAFMYMDTSREIQYKLYNLNLINDEYFSVGFNQDFDGGCWFIVKVNA